MLATGNPAATFAVTAETLPDGLTINAATGAITGTPAEVGSFPFTLTVSNGTGPDATASYTMVIHPGAGSDYLGRSRQWTSRGGLLVPGGGVGFSGGHVRR